MTPLLIFYNVPPAVAVATGANQIVASSITGVIAHMRRGTVDFKLGLMLLLGGLAGAAVGVFVFSLLRRLGQLDLIIAILYVVFLSSIGTLMLIESRRARRKLQGGRTHRRAPAGPAQLDSRPAAENAVSQIQAVPQFDSGAGARRRDRPADVDHGRRRRLHHGAGA